MINKKIKLSINKPEIVCIKLFMYIIWVRIRDSKSLNTVTVRLGTCTRICIAACRKLHTLKKNARSGWVSHSLDDLL